MTLQIPWSIVSGKLSKVYVLDQHSLIKLSTGMESSLSRLANPGATGQVWLRSTWHVATVAKKQNLEFYFIVIRV